MNCGYCLKSNKEPEFVFETKHWLVFLVATDQSYLGRCEILLKRHAENLSELKQDELLDFLNLARRMESAFKKAFDAKMFNWACLLNNAYQEKNPKPHVHWHFRPRYDKDVEFEGTIFKDLEFGHHYNRENGFKVSDGLRDRIISKIRGNLN